MEKLDVLILSASTGNGHISAGKALEEEARARGLAAKHVDVLDYTPKGFKAWYRGGYELLVKRKPELWGDLYEKSDRPGVEYTFQTGLDMTFCAPIDDLILSARPGWVLCTHSLPQPRVDRVREDLPGLKMGVVVTDLYPHIFWMRGKPDHWFVPSDWSEEQLIARHPEAKGRITVTGIPISTAFAEEESVSEARRKMDMPESGSLVLLTAGGIGAGPVGPLLTALHRLGEPMTVAAVCGRNKRAQKQVQKTMDNLVDSRLDVRILGHVSSGEMAHLMHGCDLLVGKPGGLTTTEALAAGCPFVVADPFMIPGQEEGNADFLAAEGMGVRGATEQEAAELIVQLLRDPARRQSMRDAAKRHAKPYGSRAIISRILELGLVPG